MSEHRSDKEQSQPGLSRGEIYFQLRSRTAADREDLLKKVDRIRQDAGLEKILGLGLLTVSSICVRDCLYCGYRASNPDLERFRLTRSEIVEAAGKAKSLGVKSMLLKAGEDPGLSDQTVGELIKELTESLRLEVHLSAGEKSIEVYRAWEKKGAGTYWLRHETCDPHLYRRIRPSMYWVDRVRSLETIKKTGMELGTGILIGMPNQSFESLLEDIYFLTDPAIKYLVVEPYLPPVGSKGHQLVQRPENLIVTHGLETMEKVMAILRILRPDMVIALSRNHVKMYDAIQSGSLFRAGANALVMDFTPDKYMETEAQAPFTGYPSLSAEDVDEVKEKLDNQGLSLTFEK